MRIQFIMQRGINVHCGYEKKESGNTTFITHSSTGKLLLSVNDSLKVYKLYKNKIFKSKTKEQIEMFFQEKGYKKI